MIQCGTALCVEGEYCCNEKCSICARHEDSCAQDCTTQGCLKDSDCPVVSCDAGSTKCPQMTCIANECVVQPFVGTNIDCLQDSDCPQATCVSGSTECLQMICIMNQCTYPSLDYDNRSGGNNCGLTTKCKDGYVCCNASCGICTLPGQVCHQMKCINPVDAINP